MSGATKTDLSTRLLSRLYGDAVPLDRLDEAMRVREAALAIALEDAAEIQPPVIPSAPADPGAAPVAVVAAGGALPTGAGGSSTEEPVAHWSAETPKHCSTCCARLTERLSIESGICRPCDSIARLRPEPIPPAAAEASPTSSALLSGAEQEGATPPPAADQAAARAVFVASVAEVPEPTLARSCKRKGCGKKLRSDNTKGVCSDFKRCSGEPLPPGSIAHKPKAPSPKTPEQVSARAVAILAARKPAPTPAASTPTQRLIENAVSLRPATAARTTDGAWIVRDAQGGRMTRFEGEEAREQAQAYAEKFNAGKDGASSEPRPAAFSR